MSLDTSCPSILPDGIIRNTTGFRGPQGPERVYAGTVQNRDGRPPNNQTMHAMIDCCVNQVYAGEIESAYVLPDADFETHCALWCEWDLVRRSDRERTERPWISCMQNRTDSQIGIWTAGYLDDDEGDHAPAMGANLGLPSMLGLALASLLVASAIVG